MEFSSIYKLLKLETHVHFVYRLTSVEGEYGDEEGDT